MANHIGNLQNKNGDLLFPVDMEIIENDNGTALKFSNGVMICHRIYAQNNITYGEYYNESFRCSSSIRVNFPIGFIDTPTVNVIPASPNNFSTSIAGICPAYFDFVLCAPSTGLGSSSFICWIAIGKWK